MAAAAASAAACGFVNKESAICIDVRSSWRTVGLGLGLSGSASNGGSLAMTAWNRTAMTAWNRSDGASGSTRRVFCCRAERIEERSRAELLDESRRMIEDYTRLREEYKEQGFRDYGALKEELSLTTVNVAVGVAAYCVLVLSFEEALSYGIGALASLCYLQLLYRHVDDICADNVPPIFVPIRQRKTIGITSDDVRNSIERTVRGSIRALASPRLVIPIALFALWGLQSRFVPESPVHLKVAPLMFGFFAYKGAALFQAYKDNKDLLLELPGPKGPADI